MDYNPIYSDKKLRYTAHITKGHNDELQCKIFFVFKRAGVQCDM